MNDAEIVALLRREISVMTPVDDRHAMSIDRFLTELDRLPAPLDEHADPVHVTASAIVTGSRGTVLHRHKRLGLWLQPGGHIDRDETPWDAAVRETREETGLAPTHAGAAPQLVHVDVHDGGRGHTHLDLRYLLLAGDDDPTPPADESPHVRWFAWDDAIALADAGLSGALRTLAPGQSPPTPASN